MLRNIVSLNEFSIPIEDPIISIIVWNDIVIFPQWLFDRKEKMLFFPL